MIAIMIISNDLVIYQKISGNGLILFISDNLFFYDDS